MHSCFTWLTKLDVENLLDELVVCGDLVDGDWSVLDTDDRDWNYLIPESSPNQSTAIFPHLKQLRPQSKEWDDKN